MMRGELSSHAKIAETLSLHFGIAYISVPSGLSPGDKCFLKASKVVWFIFFDNLTKNEKTCLSLHGSNASIMSFRVVLRK